jgi:hypothetical protein
MAEIMHSMIRIDVMYKQANPVDIFKLCGACLIRKYPEYAQQQNTMQ